MVGLYLIDDIIYRRGSTGGCGAFRALDRDAGGRSRSDVTVRVGDTTVSGGGSITATENPQVTVEVSAESTVDSVSVCVDGEPRRTFSPESNSVSRTFALEPTDGRHDLTVVASASGTTSRSGMVIKDSTGPRVSFTEPFTTSRSGSPNDVVTVDWGNVTLAGGLHDLSGVEKATSSGCTSGRSPARPDPTGRPTGSPTQSTRSPGRCFSASGPTR